MQRITTRIVLSFAIFTFGWALANAPENPLPPLAAAGGTTARSQATTYDKEAAAIQQVMDAYTADIDAGDLDAWMALWAPGGVQMPPGTPMRSGLKAIRAGMAPGLTRLNDEIHINVMEETVVGNLGYARGTYTLVATPRMDRRGEAGGVSIVDGKFLTVLRQQPDGSWKIYRDIFNSNVPPQ